jgi:hypothetical protein
MIPTLNSSSRSRRLVGVVLSLGILGSLAVVQNAEAAILNTIVDSVGFEQPKFDPAFFPPGGYAGQLEGQAPFPEPLPVGTWLRTKNTGNSTAKVINTVAAPGGGTQSVQVDRTANSEVRWAVPVSGWPSQRYICIDWDMRVEQAATPALSFGPFFGVEAYDDDAASIGLLASLGVDAATGEVLFQEGGNGFFVAPGPTVTFGAWNHFTILLDYLEHDFEVYVNMAQVNTNPLVSDEFVDHAEVLGGLNEFTDADIAALAAGGDPGSLNATGTAYFDNFSVVESDVNPCVPEPTTVALAVLGLAGVQGVRRNRRK